MRKIIFYIGLVLVGAFLMVSGTAYALGSPIFTFGGGTGTTSPSGILAGDNGATNHLNTVKIGSGITFDGTTISASGGSGTPGGSSGQIQYNGTGAFAGVSTTTLINGTNITFSGGTPVIIGTTPITINASGGGGSGTVGTSTNETAGFLPYWTTTSATPALLGKVATTTLTGSGVISITNSPVLIGASPAVATLTGGSNGQVLGWLSGIPTWTASTTVAAGTGISVATAGSVNTVTNTGVISNSCPGGFLTCSGTNPSSFTLGTLGITNGGTGTSTSGIQGQNVIIGASGIFTGTSTIFTATNQNVGIGSTTPWAQFSINPSGVTGPEFTVGSSTKTDLVVTNNGRVGIGTTSPMDLLSVMGTTTIAGNFLHVGTNFCNGGLYSQGLQGTEYCGNDNNTFRGVQNWIENKNPGANAWVGMDMGNNLSDSSVTHYFGLFYNSSNYTDSTFGTAIAKKSLAFIQNSDGEIDIISSTSTEALNPAGVAILTGGTNSGPEGNERLRVAVNGTVGIGSSTPHAQLSVNRGNQYGTGNLIEASYSTGATNNATTTVFTLASSTVSSLLIGTTTPANGSASATSTIYMQKLQWQGGNSAGTTYCVFLNASGALTTQSGPCL